MSWLISLHSYKFKSLRIKFNSTAELLNFLMVSFLTAATIILPLLSFVLMNDRMGIQISVINWKR